MKPLNTITPAAAHDLFDYAVVDQQHENIGTLHSMWNNEHTGALGFLGVKTGWLFGSNHVVPAAKAVWLRHSPCCLVRWRRPLAAGQLPRAMAAA